MPSGWQHRKSGRKRYVAELHRMQLNQARSPKALLSQLLVIGALQNRLLAPAFAYARVFGNDYILRLIEAELCSKLTFNEVRPAKVLDLATSPVTN
ncbi:hypothetical protein [Pseudomaricurvus albidus]|uniref:hypothetical protein n=1 Tax=Pseudomaricurvus albidus TaxID=2842452 RepID=UPI001C0C1981|nr:hypothetical protein [Aestuariicella albida]